MPPAEARRTNLQILRTSEVVIPNCSAHLGHRRRWLLSAQGSDLAHLIVAEFWLEAWVYLAWFLRCRRILRLLRSFPEHVSHV